jgi:hypothetical protein
VRIGIIGSVSKQCDWDHARRFSLGILCRVFVDSKLLTLLFIYFVTVPNTLYRRAILKAIEGLNDYHSRSNVDLIRRNTKDILEDDEQQQWNEALFLQTLKSITRNGDITQTSHVLAELSPSYKKKRANSLSQQLLLEERLRNGGGQQQLLGNPLGAPLLPGVASSYPPYMHNMTAASAPVSIHRNSHHDHDVNHHHIHTHDGSPPKEAPHRKPEHEKWKITPKKIYDKTTSVHNKIWCIIRHLLWYSFHSFLSLSCCFPFLASLHYQTTQIYSIINPMDTH